MASSVLVLPFIVPALAAMATTLRPLRRAGWGLPLAALAGVPSLAVALLAPDGALDLPWLLLGAHLRLDGPSRVFLLLTGAVWIAAGVHAISYLAGDPRRGVFAGWWCLALAGNAGLVVAGDAATFYLCFALMSFASYGLVVHDRTPEAVRAGQVYLALVIVGEIAVFACLVLGTQMAGGSPRFADIVAAAAGHPHRGFLVAAALVGFGVKAGALGLHVWLPVAHPAAPTPASAVLSGVMVKAGLLGWLNVLPVAEMTAFAGFALAAGILAAFYGVAVGLTQRDPKAILAYSTVSQMGLVAMGLGASLAGAGAREVALTVLPLFALHHGLAKGALFLGVSVVRGGGRGGRIAAAAMLVPALALAAAPVSSGALAKGGLKEVIAAAGLGGPAVPVLLSLSSAGTALLLAHLLRILWWPRPRDAHASAHPAGVGQWIPFVAVSVAAFALPVALGDVGELFAGATGDLWPVALGFALMLTLWNFPLGAVPLGDVLALYVRVGRRAWLPIQGGDAAPSPPSGWRERASDWAAGREALLGAAGGRGIAFALMVAALHLLLGTPR